MSAQITNQGRLMQVLLSPVITEKATMLAERRNQYTFKVLQSATKDEIKAAIELLFKVEVTSVQVLNQKGKVKRFGRSMGRRNNTRKAFVSLKEGQSIELAQEAV